MNNSAFSLIELMAVIIVLSIIAIITTPVVFNVVSSVRDELSDEQKLIVENAARMWGINNLSVNDNEPISIEKSSKINSITLSELKEKGFIEKKDLKNISNNSMDNYGVCISYDNQFVYEFTENVDECGS